MMWAVNEGHPKVVKLLLKHGADATKTTKDGNTALMAASIKGHDHIVKIILDSGLGGGAEGGAEEGGQEGGESMRVAAERAAARGKKTTLEFDIDNSNTEGSTALLWAARKNHLAALKVLLDRGAKIDKHDRSGSSPLMWAAYHGYVEEGRGGERAEGG